MPYDEYENHFPVTLTMPVQQSDCTSRLPTGAMLNRGTAPLAANNSVNSTEPSMPNKDLRRPPKKSARLPVTNLPSARRPGR